MARLKSLALAAAIAAMAGVAGSGQATAQDVLKVGAINPYSGPLALYGDELARGYQLAADELNAAGGVLGRQIELIRGDAGNPQQAIATVEQLSTQEGVELYVGTYVSAVSNAASDAAMRFNTIYWDTNALAAELTERGLPNFIRSGPYANSFAEVSVATIRDLIAPALGKSIEDVTVWIEHEESIYGTSIAEIQKEGLEAAGAKVLGVGAHSYKAIDLTDSVLRAKSADPDVWLQTGYVPDGNLLLKTAREQEFKPRAILFVGTGDTFETLDALGAEYLEGILVVSYPRPDIKEEYGPGAADYLAAYKAKYQRDPIAPQGMTAYVGFKMLMEAVEAAGSTDMEAVRAAAAAMDRPDNSYATGFGAKFDENMQNTRAMPTVIQWQSGKQVTVFPPEAASVEPVGLARP